MYDIIIGLVRLRCCFTELTCVCYYRNKIAAVTLTTSSIVVGSALFMVMGEEINCLSYKFRRMSANLARANFARKLFICCLVAVISIGATVNWASI